MHCEEREKEGSAKINTPSTYSCLSTYGELVFFKEHIWNNADGAVRSTFQRVNCLTFAKSKWRICQDLE